MNGRLPLPCGRLPALGALICALAAPPSAAQSADRQARAWAAACAACHGSEGRSEGAIPSIAGREAGELYRAMVEFRDGQRTYATVMHQHARGYSDDELRRIARFFAARPAR
ncbi:MAG TPA: c-type cytochrome [Zeimonas sp.]|nr:c-type cytochrome [Zeimonas sp.]